MTAPAAGAASRRTTVIRRLATAGLVALLVWPAVRDQDSHPLSTYPMYARNRDDTVAFVVAIGKTVDDQRVELSLDTIARVDDPLIAAARLRDAVAEGRAASVCAEIAGRAPAAAARIEIATERRQVVEHVRGDDSLVRRDLHATCPGPSASGVAP